MAELHSTRRKAKSARLQSVDRRSVERPELQRQRASLSRSSLSYGPTTSVQLAAQLREVSRLLTVIYSLQSRSAGRLRSSIRWLLNWER